MPTIKISRVAQFLLIVYSVAASLVRIKAPGNILEGHRISLYMGNPQVEAQDMILDTGSSLTILPCASCVKCFGLKEKIKYDPAVSFTSSAIKCVPIPTFRTLISASAIKDAKRTNNFVNTIYNI